MKFLDTLRNLFNNPLYAEYDVRQNGVFPPKGMRHRFHNSAAALGVLIIYEILIFFFHTSQVVKFQGGDFWFLLYRWVPFHTLPISLCILVYYGYYIRIDYYGIKDGFEQQIDALLKSKDLPPLPKKQWRFNPLFGLRMLMEAFFFAALLYVILPHLTAYLLDNLFPNANLVPLHSRQLWDYQTTVMQSLAIAFGSGFYEEAIFRYGLITVLNKSLSKYLPVRDKIWGLVPIPSSQNAFLSRLLVVIVGAFIYSLSHFLLIPFLNPNAELFTLYNLIYRFLYGIFMSYVLIYRKFGITVWTHTLYEILYFTFY